MNRNFVDCLNVYRGIIENDPVVGALFLAYFPLDLNLLKTLIEAQCLPIESYLTYLNILLSPKSFNFKLENQNTLVINYFIILIQ